MSGITIVRDNCDVAVIVGKAREFSSEPWVIDSIHHSIHLESIMVRIVIHTPAFNVVSGINAVLTPVFDTGVICIISCLNGKIIFRSIIVL